MLGSLKERRPTAFARFLLSDMLSEARLPSVCMGMYISDSDIWYRCIDLWRRVRHCIVPRERRRIERSCAALDTGFSFLYAIHHGQDCVQHVLVPNRTAYVTVCIG